MDARVALGEPGRDLAAQDTLAPRGVLALAVDDQHAALAARALLAEEAIERRAGLLRAHAVQIEPRVDREEPATQLAQHVGGHARATALHAVAVVLDLEATTLDQGAEVPLHRFGLLGGVGFGERAPLVELARREGVLRARDALRPRAQRGHAAHYAVEGEGFVVGRGRDRGLRSARGGGLRAG